MAAKFTELTHKMEIQQHLAAENCIICTSRSRRLVRKLLDHPLIYVIIGTVKAKQVDVRSSHAKRRIEIQVVREENEEES
jgi:hypothetical protein